ncbi:FliH/SctL family protein [Syntrophus aciditrophicus]|nr:FliH/SctL family protein [Syntrophus aciditrophicus]
MNIYKQSRIIKSQDVFFVSSVANNRSDFIPFTLNEKQEHQHPDETEKSLEMEKKLQEMEMKIKAAGKEGYEEGFAEGFKQGSEASKHKKVAVMNTLHALVEEVGSFKQKTLQSSEKQMLELCISIAEKIIHQEVSTDRGVIISVLKAAFQKITERENIKIRLHPNDYQYLVEIKSDFINGMNGVRNVFFEEDRSIPQGGAILETSSGKVDARISEQLQEVKAGLLSLHAS